MLWTNYLTKQNIYLCKFVYSNEIRLVNENYLLLVCVFIIDVVRQPPPSLTWPWNPTDDNVPNEIARANIFISQMPSII